MKSTNTQERSRIESLDYVYPGGLTDPSRENIKTDTIEGDIIPFVSYTGESEEQTAPGIESSKFSGSSEPEGNGLSLDNKRLIQAIGAAIVIHIALFLYIDIIFPLIRTESEKILPTEMTVSMEFLPPVETVQKDPVSEIPEESPADVPPEPVEQVELPEPEPVPEPISEPEPLPEPVVQPVEAVEPPPAPAEAPPVETPPEPVNSTPVESSAAPAPVSRPADSQAAPEPVTFRTLSRGKRLKAPSYPDAARRWKWEGTVKVAIEIAADGTILHVSLRSSSGHSLLDNEVITTIEDYWSFNPPGRKITLNKNFTFRLN